MELQYKVQNYDWGKLGKDSTVAKLLSSADPNITIDSEKPYAELWMGTHPNGPSLILERNVLLSEYIKDNLDAIGPAVRRRFGVAVPFLFKILSVRKALSIQAHPNKGAMELQYKVQNYDWGKLGKDSTVAKLLSSADPNITIDSEKPYAELWMGTHPNGPSLILERNVLLSEYIKDNLDAIGPAVRRRFGVAVPFLFKILSVRKALSIQAHPNKEHAEELHRNFPDLYKDPNHKPELAIALTPFEALCGFRPLEEIQNHLKKLPELTRILSDESVTAFFAHKEHGESGIPLKQVFSSLMSCDKAVVAASLQSLLARLEKEESSHSSLMYPLLQRIHSEYPGDVGCYALYFMNYLQLRPGQAIFLNANMPHAYLSGDCVECMACSDNVVRAGLTPKLIDVPTLVGMLDYSSYTPEHLLFCPQLEDSNSCIWRPPVPDFAVVKIRVESEDTYNTAIRASPSLLIVTSGAGTACDTEPVRARPGLVLFLKASRQLTLTPDPGTHLELYQAICNV